jgi:hypothetical protein
MQKPNLGNPVVTAFRYKDFILIHSVQALPETCPLCLGGQQSMGGYSGYCIRGRVYWEPTT